METIVEQVAADANVKVVVHNKPKGEDGKTQGMSRRSRRRRRSVVGDGGQGSPRVPSPSTPPRLQGQSISTSRSPPAWRTRW